MQKIKSVIPAIFFLLSIIMTAVFVSCGNNEANGNVTEENLTSGTGTMYVDNSVQPVVEDVLAVFKSRYPNVNLSQENMPETDVIRMMLKDSARIAVLTRTLTKAEENDFLKRKITPKITPFAKDAIALVSGKGGDTTVDLQDVVNIFQGKPSKIKSLVFDSPSSGAVQFLIKRAGIKNINAQNIYSLQSNAEVLKYVQNNNGAVGVIGSNLLLQPTKDVAGLVENIEVLAVSNVKKNNETVKYYKPNQSNIAAGSYPLIRTLYVLNYQGKLGLGMGFANYATSPDGQRIILKSGLLPLTMPTREIEVNNDL